MKYIIALMGPSQSGKSFVIKKIISNKCNGFNPKLVAKQATRNLRTEEKAALARGEDIDVEHVNTITADLVYQTYGQRTGIEISKLIAIANDNKVPVVVVNDIMAMAKLKKECKKRDNDICVISIFLFRKIPVKEEYFAESRKRGNVDDKETEQRFDKAKTVYRIYIENMHMFDFVMLNTINYDENDRNNGNTIVDYQIRAIRDNIILKGVCPRERCDKDKPVLYIISGNGASGKDELIEATYAMGKLYADVLPKYTSRNQKADDGPELICKMNISEHGLIENPTYNEYILLRKKYPNRFLTYIANKKYEYSIDMQNLRQYLKLGKSLVVAVSDIPTIKKLIEEFKNQAVTIYCNSQISQEEFMQKSSGDDVDLAKVSEMNNKIYEFIDNYMMFRHVVIYAENELGHASDSRQEELIDQLFRLFRAYEEKWI
ncbi:MAG: hypothetical protein J1F31_05920 [Erysipelotrichales bacterium]|nr:hypothetical protein [Erysipelotrichales bacterium]